MGDGSFQLCVDTINNKSIDRRRREPKLIKNSVFGEGGQFDRSFFNNRAVMNIFFIFIFNFKGLVS